MKLDRDTVDAIGLWTIRILLTGGAIAAALMKLDEAAGIMAALVFLTFVFL